LGTATPAELTDPELSDHKLLYRLFHEQGVRVFDARSICFGCSCSDERALAVLRRMPATEIEDLAIDGVLEVICQFCNRTQNFTPQYIMNPAPGEAGHDSKLV
ncbi:MAG: Hsp33 family molecular chaperone HslO, partial [Alphaproteobacteria bacterium]